MFLTRLSDPESTFLTETNLKEFSGYDKCVVEYLTYPHLLSFRGLIEGFISEMIREYKAAINNADILPEPLLL